ncbi:MAG: hypothetical protein OQL08_00015 [Gammaproteobacteria bacterium]|nr:hypothetical protein [Gammaproteobacteria bacterium]
MVILKKALFRWAEWYDGDFRRLQVDSAKPQYQDPFFRDELTDEGIRYIMDKLNNRPRKCLGYKMPNQVFFGINPPVALAS